MSAHPDKLSELHHCVQSCICDVNVGASANMRKLNDNKTGLMLVTSKVTTHLHSPLTSITIGNVQIHFKQSVKNLGLTLHCHLRCMHMSPILLRHATLNGVVWHQFVDFKHVQQQPILHPLLFCHELTTVAHCCSLVSLFGVHPLRMTTTSSSTLKTQHIEEESMC